VEMDSQTAFNPDITREKPCSGKFLSSPALERVARARATSDILLVALVVAVRLWIWCAPMRKGAATSSRTAPSESGFCAIMRYCAFRCWSAWNGLEIRCSIRLSYAPLSDTTCWSFRKLVDVAPDIVASEHGRCLPVANPRSPPHQPKRAEAELEIQK
jgi:hypothetical protein